MVIESDLPLEVIVHFDIVLHKASDQYKDY